MNTYLVELKINDIWLETDVLQKDFVKTEVLHSGLKAADSTLSFSITPDLTLYNLLRGAVNAEIPVRVTKNAQPYFFGYVRKDFSILKTNRLQSLRIEAVTGSYLLKRKVGKDLFYRNVSPTVLVTALLAEAGITPLAIPSISAIIPGFQIISSDSDSYHNYIKNILFEYGYTFFFDSLGRFTCYKLFPDTVVTNGQFDANNCIEKIQQTKREEEKEKVIVKWTGIATKSNAVVFSDTSGAADGKKCIISVPADTFFGGGEEWYPELKHPEGEIIAVEGITLDILQDSNITVLKFDQTGNRVLVSIKNTSLSSAGTINRLDIKAVTCVIKKDVNQSIVTKNSGTEKIETIEAKYIFDKDSGDALAAGLAWWYKYSDFDYKVTSKDNFPLGDTVLVSDSGIGSISARITKKQTDERSGVISYDLEAVSEYIPDVAEAEIHNTQPVPVSPQLLSIIADIPRTIYSGFTLIELGATIVPVNLEPTAQGAFKAINIKWNKQANLTNFLQYEIQVSMDNFAWYALRFDRVNWKGTLDEFTILTTENLVHTLPNLLDSNSSPIPLALYYRIRQRTRGDLVSEYVSCSAQSSVLDTGDYAANSISANSLKASELFALFATIGETLVVDPVAGLSAQNFNYAEGDTRTMLTAKSLLFQYILSGSWQTIVSLAMEGLMASQIYSREKLYITNDDMAGRRARGYDVGRPYLSELSRVIHWDSDLLDHTGVEYFTMTGTGALVGKEDGITPAIVAVAPYATDARSLYGNFRLQKNIGFANVFTVDFWSKYYFNENQELFRIGSTNEYVSIDVLNAEPYYNDDSAFQYNNVVSSSVWYNEIRAASARVVYYYNSSFDIRYIEDEDGNPSLTPGKWYHFGIIESGTVLVVLINAERFEFVSPGTRTESVLIDINSSLGQFLIDEALIDPTVAEAEADFLVNNTAKKPWAKLSDAHEWFVLDAKDPAYIKTNIFESSVFQEAVQAIIDAQ